jgi:RNA polymerase sigma factor (sigma-70 family)
VLGDSHDAEDALQATFLVLAKRSRSIREPGSVAPWLARVARRVAIKAKARSTVRRVREREAALREARRTMSGPPESYAEIYEEIDRLPAKFRGPLVLCDLEGLSYEQAAGQLLVPVGTVRSRLARARERLGDRLRRRGLVPCGVGLAIGLGPRPAPASPPVATTEAILRAAMDVGGGSPIAGAISAEAVRLASLYLRSRSMVRMRMIAMTVVSAGLVALGAGMRGIHPGFAVVAGEPPAIAEAPAGDALFARVVDMQGRPVPGQQVHVWGDSPERQTLKTDVEGRIRIPDNGVIGPRHLLLLAMPDEKRIGWASLGIAAEDLARGTADDPLTLTLEPRDSPVTGTVVDRAGRPIAGAEVHVEHLRDDTNGLFMGSGLTVRGRDRRPGAIHDPLAAGHRRRHAGPAPALLRPLDRIQSGEGADRSDHARPGRKHRRRRHRRGDGPAAGRGIRGGADGGIPDEARRRLGRRDDGRPRAVRNRRA